MGAFAYAFAIVMLGLTAVGVFAINTSIKALRLADPALYRAAASDHAGARLSAGATGRSQPGSWILLRQMHRWMRKHWRHRDVHKHRSVRRWMYVYHGARSALVAVVGFGVTLLLLH